MTLGHVVFAVHAALALVRGRPVRDEATLFRPLPADSAGRTTS